ncbi:MAG: nucleotide-binding protein [Deltaproteobacteria bacterium]|nr:nucleotide-binding protein [Deltaproteobacteria bacterium]
MKPRVFVGSSTESLDIANSIHENLEHNAEVTIWTQGIFELSKSSLDSLLGTLDAFDFGVFVFSPDDISVIHGKEHATVRDNIVFELGLFIGRLGKERNFIVLPRGHEETLHLPTDLLGLTPALYEPNRQDGNLCAALGPACSKLSKAFTGLGKLKIAPTAEGGKSVESHLQYSEGDKKAILASWMGSRPASLNSQVIHFAEVDRELRLEPGTTKKYIKEIAARWNHVVAHEGDRTILFRTEPVRIEIVRRTPSTW